MIEDATKNLIWLEMKAASAMFMNVGRNGAPLLPIWLLELKNGERHAFGTPFGSPDEKPLYIDYMRGYMREHDVVRYAFACEAWMVLGKQPESSKLGASLASHPDRTEVLIVSGEDYRGHASAMRRILRPEHGRPVLSAVEWDLTVAAGQFTNLLPKGAQ